MVSIFEDMYSEMDPYHIFRLWYTQAQETGMKEPGKMTLATVGPGNRPSARIVLLKKFDERGFATEQRDPFLRMAQRGNETLRGTLPWQASTQA